MSRLLVVASLCALAGIAWSAKATSSITDGELQKLSEQLFQADANNQAAAVSINLQSRTSSGATDDKASDPLLTVGSKSLAVDTIALLRKLYDNYEPDTSVAEVRTAAEAQEESDLLDGLLQTTVLSTAMNFLANKGLVPSSVSGQKQFLHKLWFTMYSRGGGVLGSSAFEHVFLAEVKRGEVQGLHSWLFFNNEEAAKRADYKGWIKNLKLGDKGTLLKFRFAWHGINKPVNSLIIGTSPELDMALYTVCFLARPDNQCKLSANNKSFGIKTWSFNYRGTTTIGSAYPEF